jgi:hypothetical protein
LPFLPFVASKGFLFIFSFCVIKIKKKEKRKKKKEVILFFFFALYLDAQTSKIEFPSISASFFE